MRGSGAPRRRHDEIGKGRAGDFAARRARDRRADLLEHGEPLVGRKQRRLAGMNADREHQPVGKPHGFADDVEMAVGDGIERSGKKRNPRHGGGLARAPNRCKVRLRRAP